MNEGARQQINESDRARYRQHEGHLYMRVEGEDHRARSIDKRGGEERRTKVRQCA